MRGPGAHIRVTEGQRRPRPVHGGGRDGGGPGDGAAPPGVGGHLPDEAGGRTAASRGGGGRVRTTIGADAGRLPVGGVAAVEGGAVGGDPQAVRLGGRPLVGRAWEGPPVGADGPSGAGVPRRAAPRACRADLVRRGQGAAHGAVGRGEAGLRRPQRGGGGRVAEGARQGEIRGVVPGGGRRVPGGDPGGPAVPGVGVGAGDRAAAGGAVRLCAGSTSISSAGRLVVRQSVALDGYAASVGRPKSRASIRTIGLDADTVECCARGRRASAGSWSSWPSRRRWSSPGPTGR